MANLLADPNLWSDGTSPPALWNGEAYVFTAPATITFTGTVQAGDTLDGVFASQGSGDYGYGHQIAVLVNGVDAIAWDTVDQSYPASLDITLSAGDTVAIEAKTDGCGYSPNFSLTPPAAPPVVVPTSIGPVVRQMTTHRIARGYDGALTCYVRNEQGPLDLSGKTLTVSFRAYGRNCVLASVDATQESAGKVTCTVPADVIAKQLYGSLYRFDVEADGQPAYQALIEIV